MTEARGAWLGRSWSFQRQWLRDGVPIAGANDIEYVVAAADRGHRISVRIDAAAVGITPGSATSAELLVPSGSTPSPSASPPPSSYSPPTPKRTTPNLTVTQLRQGQPRLRIRVHGKADTCTGPVVVRGPHGWQRTQTLRNGKVVVRVSKAMVAKRARLAIRYRGDTYYLPVKSTIRLRKAAH